MALHQPTKAKEEPQVKKGVKPNDEKHYIRSIRNAHNHGRLANAGHQRIPRGNGRIRRVDCPNPSRSGSSSPIQTLERTLMSDSIFFNASEAAKALGISAETVRGAVHSGELKAHKVPNTSTNRPAIRIYIGDLLSWFNTWERVA